MWVYRPTEFGYEVGYFRPDGQFERIRTYIVSRNGDDEESKDRARREVHYLNGGNFV